MDIDIAQRSSQQWPRSAGITLGRHLIRHVSAVYFGSAPRSPVSSRPARPLLGIADPPLRDRTGGASNCASNRPARHAVRSQKHDPSPLPQTARPPQARQTIEISTLLHRQNAKCRFRDADHASLNHDSFISDSGYYSLMSSPSRAVESAAVANLSIEAKKIVVAGDYVTVMKFRPRHRQIPPHQAGAGDAASAGCASTAGGVCPGAPDPSAARQGGDDSAALASRQSRSWGLVG